MELGGGEVSSNLGACLVNTFLLDLQVMDFLNPSISLKDIILDKSKINWEKSKSNYLSEACLRLWQSHMDGGWL